MSLAFLIDEMSDLARWKKKKANLHLVVLVLGTFKNSPILTLRLPKEDQVLNLRLTTIINNTYLSSASCA